MSNTTSHVPPGFRFHPTDEELVDYYLRKKVASRRIDLDVIKDVDLYKIEPWDLQELCRLGTEEQTEWYFFSHKDKKYPTGTRTNRATTAGFWKATGRDKPIYVKHILIGMRKTLVFYRGRAPNGQKSDWIMHEYRLETNENGFSQEDGWVVCKVFKKRVPMTTKASEHEWYDEQGSFVTEDLSPSKRATFDQTNASYHHHLLPASYNRGVKLNYPMSTHESTTCHLLPHLESPKIPNYMNSAECSQQSFIISPDETVVQPDAGHQLQIISIFNNISHDHSMHQATDHQVMDWRVLDKFVASQLSHDAPKPPEYCHVDGLPQVLEKPDVAVDYASTSTSSGQTDPYLK